MNQKRRPNYPKKGLGILLEPENYKYLSSLSDYKGLSMGATINSILSDHRRKGLGLSESEKILVEDLTSNP